MVDVWYLYYHIELGELSLIFLLKLVSENETHRLVLDTSRTLFELSTDCDFAEYMPIMSTIFAGVWITLFTMCPRGGRTRTGLVTN